jgi:hypothetical protein
MKYMKNQRKKTKKVMITIRSRPRRSCKYNQQIGMQNNIRETCSTTQVK